MSSPNFISGPALILMTYLSRAACLNILFQSNILILSALKFFSFEQVSTRLIMSLIQQI